MKKLILLAVYPNVPECHENISTILSDLGIEAIDFGITADLKMLLILIGKPQGKPKFNSPRSIETHAFLKLNLHLAPNLHILGCVFFAV